MEFSGRFCDDRIGLDFYFDVRSCFELYFLPLSIGQIVRNPNLSVKMICALDRDLSLFRFAGSGMSVNDSFDFTWERSTRF